MQIFLNKLIKKLIKTFYMSLIINLVYNIYIYNLTQVLFKISTLAACFQWSLLYNPTYDLSTLDQCKGNFYMAILGYFLNQSIALSGYSSYLSKAVPSLKTLSNDSGQTGFIVADSQSRTR